MSTKTINLYYKGLGIHPSECLVHLDDTIEEGKTYICFEDIGKGISVTNAAELIARLIVVDEELDPVKCRFFEMYDHYDHLDEIIYSWNDREPTIWTWQPADDSHANQFFLKIKG